MSTMSSRIMANGYSLSTRIVIVSIVHSHLSMNILYNHVSPLTFAFTSYCLQFLSLPQAPRSKAANPQIV